jgi:small subunit ribosomal protein S1
MEHTSGKTEEGGSFAGEFARLFEEQVNKISNGAIVSGKVTDINRDFVTVDIGFKSEGVVPTEQFLNEEGALAVKRGDEVDVLIIMLENEFGQVVLSKEKADQKRIWEQVEDICKQDGIVSGKVVLKVKGGLQVDIGIPAFLPGSQIDLRPHRNLDKFLGQYYDFKVLKMTRDKGNIVLSRRALLMSERESLRKETLLVLDEGIVLEGVVKNITDYGAFIDLGGIDGLLHITDMSWGRLNHPSDKISVGQVIKVVVLKYDRERERVSLGMKQLTEDPWSKVIQEYPVGARVKGKVASLTDYGAFIQLEEGVEGLIHISEMSWSKKAKHPSKVLNEGDTVEAVVLGIDSEQQRISLGLKQLLPNPWEDLRKLHPIGSRVRGKVRSITEFGIFVGVTDEIDGLVHVSDFSWTKRIKDPSEIQELYKKGDDVEAVVLDIDANNERLSLGIKQMENDPWEAIAQRYPVGARVKGSVKSIADFGVFVEIAEGVEGLIHNSQLGSERGQDVSERFAAGQQVECEVIAIDMNDRRISLSIKSLKKKEEKGEYSEYMEDTSSALTFGDLIRQKMSDAE